MVEGRSKWDCKNGDGAMTPVESSGKAPGGGLGAKPAEAGDRFRENILYFEPVLRCMHDYPIN